MFRDGAETRLFKGALAASPDEGDTGNGWESKVTSLCESGVFGGVCPAGRLLLIRIHNLTERLIAGVITFVTTYAV